jgi:acetyl-CoA carboxylase biotin carboxyl carrier protein
MHDVKTIKELAEIMTKNEIVDLILEEGEKKLVLSRAKEIVQAAPVQMAAPVYQAAPVAAPAAAPAASPAATPAVASGLTDIKAPMVGTFYRSPSPTAASFVEVGSKVKVGDVLCIIEAMKLMNEIKAEIAGEIAEICAENGSPIEYGQPLFRIKKA